MPVTEPLPPERFRPTHAKDHFGAMSDRRFPQDVLDFVRQHPHIPA